MKIVVAADKFKGTLNAVDVCNIIKKAFLSVFEDAIIDVAPVADGGEGTLDVFLQQEHTHKERCLVRGPLTKKIESFYVMNTKTNKAIIELAKVCGIQLIRECDLNPKITTTYGVGEMIIHALDLGVRDFIIGLGGSCTNDGGAGMIQALGAKLYDFDGKKLNQGGVNLRKLSKIDISALDERLKDSTFLIASDVKNQLTGPLGATRVFASQKGANEEDVIMLEEALINYKYIITKLTNKNLDIEGIGAAGGLSTPLLAFSNTKIESGIDVVLKNINLSERLKQADICITGEGKTDEQTKYGKAPYGVASLARKVKPDIVNICISGSVTENISELFDIFDIIIPTIKNSSASLENIKKNSEKMLYKAAFGVAQSIFTNLKMHNRYL
ncbi:glycerate kinase [Mycoplasmatota bacterium WC30]